MFPNSGRALIGDGWLRPTFSRQTPNGGRLQALESDRGGEASLVERETAQTVT